MEDAFQACKHRRKSGICDISFKYVEHKADHDKRHSMSSNWASLVCMNLEAFTIGDAVLLSGKGISHRLVVESVSACMARKATSTITKRFYALNRFVGYCGKSGLQCFPILERVMFEYLQFLAKDEKSAPSSGRSFLEAVNFACATLGLRSDLAVLGTRRIDGVSAELVKRGDPIEQASPLTVSQVIQLERMTAQATDMRDRIVLGGLLILLYGCARVSDGQRVHSYILDADLTVLDPTSLDEQGYFEMQVLGCKTARTETLRRLFLPVVAPIYDLGSANWFRSWIQARRALGLEVEGRASGPLICRFNNDGKPTSQEATSAEVTKVLREVLKIPPEDARKIRSHSLKCTLLSWACKAFVPLELRRLLGHHLDVNSRSPETYSRDSMAPALHQLIGVLRQVKQGAFAPDASRSGRFVKDLADAVPVDKKADEEQAESDDEEDYEPSSSDSDEASEEEITDASDTSLLWHLVDQGLRPDFVQIPDSYQVYRNNASGMQHLKRLGAIKLLCGRRVSDRYTYYAGMPLRDVAFCEVCENGGV